ncbi:MAG: bifunctional metallophosphatase/5'-nucleotidase [Anaerolineae bacterium]
MPNSQPIPPGTLQLVEAAPNPHGAPATRLFLVQGDATVERIEQIIPAPGTDLPPRRATGDGPFRLRILHINDVHGHLLRFGSRGHRPIFSKIAWRIRELRQKHRDDPHTAVLALSAGDDLVGAVFDELLGDDPDSFQLHAGYRLYSAAGIDGGAFGNHDLDLGTRLIALGIRQDARFPLLSANLVGSRWLDGLYHPAAIFVTKGVRVGVIGLTTPAAIKPQRDSGVHVVNPVQVVHHLLPALRPLCDVLVILSHLGYSLATNSAAVTEAGDVELARSLPPGSVQLIVGGHTHHVLNEQGLSATNIINRVPIVQAGALGRFLGEVDITVQHTAHVTNARLTPTADLPEDEEFEQVHVQPLVALAEPLFKRVLGSVADHPDLTTDAVRNGFAAGELALANFVADALVTRCRANGHNVDLAVVDASCLRCGLPGPEVTFGDWFAIMPFADTIRICWLTGRQLKELVEDNARRADQPGEPHTERGFIQFSRQLRYILTLNNSREQATATNITVNSLPLDEQLERSFLMACSSYLGQYAAAQPGAMAGANSWPHLETHLLLRDELVTYIRDSGGVTTEAGARRDGRLQVIQPLNSGVGSKE